jgi:hypothetical protein
VSDNPATHEPARLTLRFTPTADGARITWESFAGGTASSVFQMPYAGEELALVIKALDSVQHPEHPQRGPRFNEQEQEWLQNRGFWQGKRVVSDLHQQVGRQLYAALIDDRQAEMALRLARENARSQGQALTYILRFPPEAIELAALPWEAIWDNRQAVLLSRGNRQIDSLERYLDLDEALSPPLPAGKKLHILALSPQALIPPKIRDEERAAREKSWNALKVQGLLDWDELTTLTARALDDRMRQGPPPDIIHYFGHGIYQNGQGYLLFDSDNGPVNHELVSAARLAALLGGIRLIVTQACQSAMVSAELPAGLFTGVAPALSAVSEAVVAMQLTTRISAATRFSDVFYSELARGHSVQAAVAAARRSLYVIESDGSGWYVPTLYIRTREQRPLYLVQPSDEQADPPVPPDNQTSDTTAQEPAVRKLSMPQIRQLVELLLACPAMQNSSTRNSVLDFLDARVRNAIKRSNQTRGDVLNIVTTCKEYPGALQTLVDSVRFFDQGTTAMQELDAFWQTMV